MAGYHTPFAAHSSVPADAYPRLGEEHAKAGGHSATAGGRPPLPPGLRASTRLSSLMLDDSFDALLPLSPSLDNFLAAAGSARMDSRAPSQQLLPGHRFSQMASMNSLDLNWLIHGCDGSSGGDGELRGPAAEAEGEGKDGLASMQLNGGAGDGDCLAAAGDRAAARRPHHVPAGAVTSAAAAAAAPPHSVPSLLAAQQQLLEQYHQQPMQQYQQVEVVVAPRTPQSHFSPAELLVGSTQLSPQLPAVQPLVPRCSPPAATDPHPADAVGTASPLAPLTLYLAEAQRAAAACQQQQRRQKQRQRQQQQQVLNGAAVATAAADSPTSPVIKSDPEVAAASAAQSYAAQCDAAAAHAAHAMALQQHMYLQSLMLACCNGYGSGCAGAVAGGAGIPPELLAQYSASLAAASSSSLASPAAAKYRERPQLVPSWLPGSSEPAAPGSVSLGASLGASTRQLPITTSLPASAAGAAGTALPTSALNSYTGYGLGLSPGGALAADPSMCPFAVAFGPSPSGVSGLGFQGLPNGGLHTQVLSSYHSGLTTQDKMAVWAQQNALMAAITSSPCPEMAAATLKSGWAAHATGAGGLMLPCGVPQGPLPHHYHQQAASMQVKITTTPALRLATVSPVRVAQMAPSASLTLSCGKGASSGTAGTASSGLPE